MSGDLHFFKTINFYSAYSQARLLERDHTKITKYKINQRTKHSCHSRRLIKLEVTRPAGNLGRSSPKVFSSPYVLIPSSLSKRFPIRARLGRPMPHQLTARSPRAEMKGWKNEGDGAGRLLKEQCRMRVGREKRRRHTWSGDQLKQRPRGRN